MTLPVIAALLPLLCGTQAAGISGENGASPRCVKVQDCFHECSGLYGKPFELDGKKCTRENTAYECCEIFCGDFLFNKETTLDCTYPNGTKTNPPWTECEDPTVTPQSTTQTSAVTRSARDLSKSGLQDNPVSPEQKGLPFREVLAIIFGLAFLIYLISHCTNYRRSMFPCSEAWIYEAHHNPPWRWYTQPSSSARNQVIDC
ncbi:uncharacterized protein [Dendrobates tinctorius]|uniref:uncharacterized protein n=1 Tax=Dendrobates tinctorius TaxID=92724 RepID=UPI003CC947F5